MLPLRDRVDLGAMAIKRYSAFPAASLSDCLVSYPGHSLGESYSSADMQSVYSTTPTDWDILISDRTTNSIFYLLVRTYENYCLKKQSKFCYILGNSIFSTYQDDDQIYIVWYHPPFPHNELVHLPYIAVATNTRAD